MNAADYKPIYDNTVVERYLDASQVGGWSRRAPTTIDPKYCLTMASAHVLASLFSPTPAIFLAPPIQQSEGSPYAAAFNHTVPWFRFPDGTERNAGQLAIYWDMPGLPASEALAFAQGDVATPVGV